MADFRALLDDRPVNAVVAWIATAALVAGAAVLLAAENWLWVAFALLTVVVVAIPPVLARDPATTLPGELVALVSLPVVVRALSLGIEVTPYVAIAGLAMLVVLVLDAFTSLEMTPRFAVAFVVITTMAFAGLWAMVQFASDVLLGTGFVEDQREMNLNLLTATLVGVVAGGVFEFYFRETDGAEPLSGASIPGRITPGTPTDAESEDPVDEGQDEATDDESDEEDRVEESPKYRLAIRALQVVLVGIVGYSLVTLDGALFVNSAVPLALSFLPTVVRWKYGYPMHAGLALLIALAAALHAVGAMGPYEATDWYDTVTHALSSTLVAGVGYSIAHGLELHTDRVDFSPRFRGVFVVLFVLAVGVLWELFEFASGLSAIVFGGEVLAQYGVDDIVKDLVFNTVGAIAVALWGTGLFRRPARALAGSVGGLLR